MKIKILLEGLSYRVGDFLIGLSVTFIFAYFFTGDLDLSTEIGSLAALTENLLNIVWYYINRKYWTGNKGFVEWVTKQLREVDK